jgi:hypothetical protein
MGEIRTAYKIFTEKPEGTTPLRRLEIEERIILKRIIGKEREWGVDWIHLAQVVTTVAIF